MDTMNTDNRKMNGERLMSRRAEDTTVAEDERMQRRFGLVFSSRSQITSARLSVTVNTTGKTNFAPII